MPTTLPPLNALRVFEAAARHLSFTHAAEELNITQSAVSHQVRGLEAWIGFELFTRHGQRLALTPGGRRYAATLGATFGQIVHATQDLITTGSHQILNLRGYGMFFVQWLIPRLPRFQALNPDIKIRLTTHVEPVDFTRDSADLAIVYGTGPWEGCRSQLLFTDTLVPVAAPRLLATLGRPRTLDQMLTLSMLHSRRREQWADWLRAAGATRRLSAKDMHFEDVTIMYQCALEGLGVAVMQIKYIERDIADGRIAIAHPFVLEREGGYHLVCPHDNVGSDKVGRFSAWLMSQDLETPPLDQLKRSRTAAARS